MFNKCLVNNDSDLILFSFYSLLTNSSAILNALPRAALNRANLACLTLTCQGKSSSSSWGAKSLPKSANLPDSTNNLKSIISMICPRASVHFFKMISLEQAATASLDRASSRRSPFGRRKLRISPAEEVEPPKSFPPQTQNPKIRTA